MINTYIKEQTLNHIYDFFVNSADFNGIPLRQIGYDLVIPYIKSIDIIIELVTEDCCMIQSSTNSHIIHSRTYSIPSQIQCLEAAKELKVEERLIGNLQIINEDTNYTICVYPSQAYLKAHRVVDGMPFFKKQLSLGMPQLMPYFFDMDVLQRYYEDPRYYFFFKNYSGRISYRSKEGMPLVREEDEVVLETFGMGYDNSGERIVVAYLRYLNGLTPEHQSFWQSKVVHPSRNPAMLQEYYDTTIAGRWVSSESVFTAFQVELNTIIELSEQIFGRSLFRTKISQDNYPKELSFFFLPTKKHFNDFVLVMDKLISENINRDFFVGKVKMTHEEEREDGKIVVTQKGTIALLTEWLTENIITTYGSLDDLLEPFKEIRKLRQAPAHSLLKDEYDTQYFGRQKDLIWRTYRSLHNLRILLSSHPNADNTIVPDWLDSTKIKNY